MAAPSNQNEITGYIHCGMCLREQSGPQQLEVGWTKAGLQVWCQRHNVNVIHIDFERHRHPVNMTASVPS